jgi:hypothetical protein
MTTRRLPCLVLALSLFLPAVTVSVPVFAEEGVSEGTPSVGSASGEIAISGSWRGAKLKCRKEEGRAVRCGKPEPFEVTFNDDGTGTSADNRFPAAFTYAWTSPTEILISPQSGEDELKLFQFELEEGFLTFQAYIYLPVEDTSLPAEVNYIHYIFDVVRED